MSTIRLSRAQRQALVWAKNKYSDGRIPPFAFRNHRSIDRLKRDGLIEYSPGYGRPMYKFTQRGLDALSAVDK